VFHFNKASIADSTVPPWVIKAKGQTFYVAHVTSNAPWSTKETPGNEATKGSIKWKKVSISIQDGEASVNSLAA
jgi:hypothetical protein